MLCLNVFFSNIYDFLSELFNNREYKDEID